MATIAEQLTSLAETKTAIKDAIVAKGVSVADTDTFRSYATKIGEISGGGGAPATKFGVSIDDLIGDVDENGNYIKPEAIDTVTYVLNGVTRAEGQGTWGNLLSSKINSRFVFPDLVFVGNYGFYYALENTQGTCEFSVLEEVVGEYAFYYAFNRTGTYDPFPRVYFPKLKRIKADHAFDSAWGNSYIEEQAMDIVFPALEEISGKNTFGYIFRSSGGPMLFTKVKTIIGSDVQNDATFTGAYTLSNAVLKIMLPSATNISGYIVKPYNTSRGITLHFAKKNQSLIEACSGYEYLFGAKEIVFDLISSIVVGGVEYNRDTSISINYYIYYSWVDASGNMVYTKNSGYTQPTVGDIVYTSDGTTQVGTVEGVE